MTPKLTGTLLKVLEPQKVSEKLTKKKFVIKTDERYPQDVAFELYNDKLGLINNFNSGDPIAVSYNVRGSEYKGNYYVNLNAWKIEAHQSEVTNSDHNSSRDLETADIPENANTDLPF